MPTRDTANRGRRPKPVATRCIDREVSGLHELRSRLRALRTRYRQRDKVARAVAKILDETQVRRWLHVGIQEWRQEEYRQTAPGRPG